MAIKRRSPFSDLFSDLLSLKKEFPERFGDFLEEEGREQRNWIPEVDVYETDDEIKLKAELPGVNKEDIEVNVENNVLTIRGEKKVEEEESGENYHRIERQFGRFKRGIRLPDGTDREKIKAEYTDGVLKISVPKTEEGKKKEIPVEIE